MIASKKQVLIIIKMVSYLRLDEQVPKVYFVAHVKMFFNIEINTYDEVYVWRKDKDGKMYLQQAFGDLSAKKA